MPVRRVLTVGEFSSLSLRVHPFVFRRGGGYHSCIDTNRVHDIAIFVRRHKFLQGDIVLSADRATRPFIVIDGVHRVEAIRGLAASGILTDADGPLVGTCTFGADEYEPDELFRMFHPSHREAWRESLRHLEDRLSTRYAPFVSHAKSPRRPNFNPSHIANAIAHLYDHVPVDSSTPRCVTEWTDFVEWRNEEVLAFDPVLAHELAATLAAKKSAFASQCFALSSIDPTHTTWVHDPAAWARWRSSQILCSASPAMQEQRHQGPRRQSFSRPQPTPSRRPPIPRALRQAVWNRYAGGPAVGSTMCLCCRITPITQQDFECGHVVAVAAGGATTLDNMRPICRTCNRSMGCMDMHAFRAAYFSIEQSIVDDPMDVED